MCCYVREQGMSPRPLSLDDLFPVVAIGLLRL